MWLCLDSYIFPCKLSCDGDLNEFFDQEMQFFPIISFRFESTSFPYKAKLKCLYYLINIQNLIAWSIFYQLKE